MKGINNITNYIKEVAEDYGFDTVKTEKMEAFLNAYTKDNGYDDDNPYQIDEIYLTNEYGFGYHALSALITNEDYLSDYKCPYEVTSREKADSLVIAVAAFINFCDDNVYKIMKKFLSESDVDVNYILGYINCMVDMGIHFSETQFSNMIILIGAWENIFGCYKVKF